MIRHCRNIDLKLLETISNISNIYMDLCFFLKNLNNITHRKNYVIFESSGT